MVRQPIDRYKATGLGSPVYIDVPPEELQESPERTRLLHVVGRRTVLLGELECSIPPQGTIIFNTFMRLTSQEPGLAYKYDDILNASGEKAFSSNAITRMVEILELLAVHNNMPADSIITRTPDSKGRTSGSGVQVGYALNKELAVVDLRSPEYIALMRNTNPLVPGTRSYHAD